MNEKEISKLFAMTYSSKEKGLCYRKRHCPEKCVDCGSCQTFASEIPHPRFRGLVTWRWNCYGRCGRQVFAEAMNDAIAFSEKLLKESYQGGIYEFKIN